MIGDDYLNTQLLKKLLNYCFHIKDLGPLKYFLGLEMLSSLLIFLSTNGSMLDILKDVGLRDAKSVIAPTETTIHLHASSGKTYLDPSPYRTVGCRFLYLTIIRFDLTFAVNLLCQYKSQPTNSHWNAAFCIVHYIKSSLAMVIFMSSKISLSLTIYVDAT